MIDTIYQMFGVIDSHAVHLASVLLVLVIVFHATYRKELDRQGRVVLPLKVLLSSYLIGCLLGCLIWFISVSMSGDPRLNADETGLWYFIQCTMVTCGPIGYGLCVLYVQLTAIRTEEPQS